MIIKSIELKNFRTYEEKTFELSPKTNVFFGENAQGKTNVLESVYTCAFGRSFRTKKDSEMVQFGTDVAFITITYQESDREKNINFALSNKNKKQIKINGIKQQKISDIFGNLLIILFSPEDMSFIKGEPSDRRKYFDLAISQLNSKYLFLLQQYYKFLEQKNILLKDEERSRNEMELDVWDEKLAEINVLISKKRKEYIEKIQETFKKYHSNIADNKEEVELFYKTQIKASRADTLEEMLKRRALDKKRGFTSIGIHRDDYIIKIDEKDLSLFGSQGQMRTAILSLKLAEKDLIYREKEEMPILLLDDVMSELDEKRRDFLSQKLKNCQVLITCTDKIEGEELKEFEIKRSDEKKDTSVL